MKRVIQILFLAANPKDSDKLRLDEEIRGIDQALQAADFRNKFDIKQYWAVRISDLQSHFLRHKPDIVHFSGHGSAAGEIILEDNFGISHPVSSAALSQLFSILKDNIRCVVLNCCYSEQQAQAIAEHIDCVIGMSQAIGDLAAISFAGAFYQALGFGKDVKTAFELGCVQINLENLGEQDKPKLLALKRDSKEIVFVKGQENVGREVSKGQRRIDQRSIKIDQSISNVASKGDTFVSTGKSRITVTRKTIEVIPFWVWIVLIAAILLTVSGIWISRYLKVEKSKGLLNFKPDEIGILVANLRPVTGTDEEKKRGQDFADDILSNLNEMTIGKTEIVINPIDSEVAPFIKTDKQALELGREFHAKLVIWGQVSIIGENKRISTMTQPIIYEKERYELNKIPKTLKQVKFESAAQSTADDIKRLSFFILGYAYYMRAESKQDLEEVIELLKNAPAESESSNDAYIHFYLGNIYYFLGRTKDAEVEFDSAVKLNNKLMEAFNNLGLLALNRYDLDDALEYFLRADRTGKCSNLIDERQWRHLNSGCVSLLSNLADVYLEKGEMALATAYYQKALLAFENFKESFSYSVQIQLYNVIAYSYILRFEQEQDFSLIESAKKNLYKVEKLIKKGSSSLSSEESKVGNASLNRNWCRIYIRLRDWNLAMNYIEKSKEFEPDNPDIHLLLAQFYNERCQPGDRDQYLEEKQLYLGAYVIDLNEGRAKWQKAFARANKLKEKCKS